MSRLYGVIDYFLEFRVKVYEVFIKDYLQFNSDMEFIIFIVTAFMVKIFIFIYLSYFVVINILILLILIVIVPMLVCYL